jgi:hypothetical protein
MASYRFLGEGRSGSELGNIRGIFGRANMNVSYLKYVLIVILAAYIGGCAHTFTPTVRDEFAPGTIPEFSSKNEVTLVNGQTNAEAVTFLRMGVHYYLANRQECSNVAVAVVKREITKRGMQVVDGNARTLKLSVVSLSSDTGGLTYDVVIRLSAHAGNGYSADYEGRCSGGVSGYQAHFAADVALNESVIAMLKDPKIQDYLTK